MEAFTKTVGGILIAVILILVLSKQGKEYSLLLTVAVCCLVSIAAIRYLEPVFVFFERLQRIGNLDSSMLEIILRAVGIGILSEITGHICTDTGNAALGKALQILACAIVLWMSVPLFTNLLELVEEILVSV